MNYLARLKITTVGLLIMLMLFCVGLLPKTQAVSPPPDGGYANENTAEGDFALFFLTIGSNNTAIGNGALFRDTTGSYNTGAGASALESNITGSYNTATGYRSLFSSNTGTYNTATGYESLYSNTTGIDNTANGVFALFDNTTGSYNTAIGDGAMEFNSTGSSNTASGFNALYSNTTGYSNTVAGVLALYNNTTGFANTASGESALYYNTTGVENTAVGNQALYSNTSGGNNTAVGLTALFANTTGSNNIALGSGAGSNLTTGSNNIDIGNVGVAAESHTIRIGTTGTQTITFVAGVRGVPVSGGQPVAVSPTGQLGIRASSARFKEAIKPMDKASEAILSLKPVTFRYKKELDPRGAAQFGLVAEQVPQVNPDLVARDDQGKPFTVRYDEVNAMLLNEFLKEHRTVQELKNEIAALTATVKEQASQIQKVGARLEVNESRSRTVLNNQ